MTRSPDSLRVGFIGLGTMGLPMARNLAKAGFPLTVASRSLAKAESLAKELPGVRAVADPSEVGKNSDIIVSSVPDAPQVEEVHLGPKGTAAGAARGTVIIDTSTIAAEATR